MARSYKFSIVRATPNGLRAEKVNVGVVVFGPNGPDVRMPEIRKLNHLTGHGWEDISLAYKSAFSGSATDTEARETELVQSEIFSLSAPGDLLARTPEEYESAVRKVLSLFVDKPALTRGERQQKINSEISSMIRQQGFLGEKTDTIDGGKVISHFVVSEKQDAVADFAYKTNFLKVVSTLDLRGLKIAAHGKACEKGATLYFAKKVFGNSVAPFGVYAANKSESATHRTEIDILDSFADGNIFNWNDTKDKIRFRQALY